MKKISLALTLLLSAPSLLGMNNQPNNQSHHQPNNQPTMIIVEYDTLLEPSMKNVREKYSSDFEWLAKHGITNQVRAKAKLGMINTYFYAEIVKNMDTITNEAITQAGSKLRLEEQNDFKDVVKQFLTSEIFQKHHEESMAACAFLLSKAYQQTLKGKR